MDWNEFKEVLAFLKSAGLETLTSPAPLDMSRIPSFKGSAFTTSVNGRVPSSIHLMPSETLALSEKRRICRQIVTKDIVCAPCLVTIGSHEDLGIFTVNSDDQDAYQQISLDHPSDAEKDIFGDIAKASKKKTTAEIIDVIYKALDYEKLSRKFFEDAEKAKSLIENDIISSMRIDKKDDEAKLVASHFAIIVMARLIFIHFLENKNLLNGQANFIKMGIVGDEEEDFEAEENLWQGVFKPIFNILSLPKGSRPRSSLSKYDFPYLNGGLFAPYEKIEAYETFNDLEISDEALRYFHVNCLYKYRLSPNEEAHNGDSRGVLDPELLGTMFEKFMRDDVAADTGSVYTPKDVVLYIVRNSLTKALQKMGVPQKVAFDLVHSKKLSSQYADAANKAVDSLKIIDPCCGSGAFLLTTVQELFEMKRTLRFVLGKSRWHNGDKRRAYEAILKNNIYGLDINEEAIILCHLRMWLPIIDMIDASSGLDSIKPLPNLGLNIRCGNAVISPKDSWSKNNYTPQNLREMSELRNQLFSCDHKKVDKIINSFSNCSGQKGAEVTLSKAFADVTFGTNKGFNLVIGNPPYLGLKDTKKLNYLQELGETEVSDLYIMVSKESFRLLSNTGVLTFVTSNSYFTDVSKKEFRKILLGQAENYPISRSSITELSSRTFKKGVNPAIFSICKSEKSSKITSIEITRSTEKKDSVNGHIACLNDEPSLYDNRAPENGQHQIEDVPVATINKVPNQNLFIPSHAKQEFLDNFGDDWQRLYSEYWPLIKASDDQTKNRKKLQEYRNSVKPYDLTLVGLLTEGGVGLQTGSNAIHLAFLDETPQAEKIKEKVAKAEKDIANGNKSAKKLLDGKKKIKTIAGTLQKKGHPYADAEWDFPYKIISEDQVLNVSSLNEAELEYIRHNGINKKIARKYKTGDRLPTHVPYYKGQSGDDNRWLSKVECYIDWSEENVRWMREVSGKKFSGAPVVRNPQFYFRKGFCWNLIRTFHIKSRTIEFPGVMDVGGMMLFANSPSVSDIYLSAFLNWNLCANLTNVISNTANTQVNDIKQLPIVIPPKEILLAIEAEVTAIANVLRGNINENLDDLSKERIRKNEEKIWHLFEGLFEKASKVTKRRVS